MSEPRSGQAPPPPPASRRPALWLLLVPVVLYCLAPLVANRIEPRVLGMPFLIFWVVAATVVSPIAIWLVSKLDPVFRAGSTEPVPADDDPDEGSTR